MFAGKELQPVAARAADRLLAYHWKIWFWGDSIGLEGLLDASELTGDDRYFGFVYGLLKSWIARERFRSEFDYTAAGLALLRTYERTGDRALLDAAFRHAGYLAGFRKTTAGAYVRYENAAIELPPALPSGHPERNSQTGGAAADGGPCVFVDCVHFDGPFFAKLFRVTGDERFHALALDNILPQIELLYDRRERLFHHFWMERTGSPNGVLWARGNGWGLLGTVLTLAGIGDHSPGARVLRDVLRDALARLRSLQDACGAWHTVLDDPGSYLESSTAAFFVDVICRAARLGVIEYADYSTVVGRALRFLEQQVNPDGVLEGVSYETFPSTRPEHYRRMPVGALAPWGQGPLLGALRSYAELAAELHAYSSPGSRDAAR